MCAQKTILVIYVVARVKSEDVVTYLKNILFLKKTMLSVTTNLEIATSVIKNRFTIPKKSFLRTCLGLASTLDTALCIIIVSFCLQKIK